MKQIYISREQLIQMDWDEVLQALEVKEWDWREEFTQTLVLEPNTVIENGERIYLLTQVVK